MGFNIWEVIIVFGVSALIIWRLFQASKKSDSSVTPKSSGETPAYLAGRKLRRTIDSAYTKSRRKSDLEARGLKYDALAKLNAFAVANDALIPENFPGPLFTKILLIFFMFRS